MEDYYLMAITRINGIGRRKIFELLKAFRSPEAIWNASLKELAAVKSMSSDYAASIHTARIKTTIESLIEELANKNIQYISILNPSYPKLLREINDPPVGIYMRGTLPSEDMDTVGIIGARRCSAYGASVAYRLAKDLGKANIVVVSGLAMGIDSESHKGVLDGGGKTMAILGCGVDICYPSSNASLMNRIIENGCVISEYPPGTAPISRNFPTRNRIISGLSRMVIVVEAAKRSGTMITADQTLENGREVFVVPGNITSNLSAGTNELIRQGCPIITNFEDVLFELGITYNESEKEQFAANISSTLSKEEAVVYKHMSHEPITADEIARRLGKPVQEVLYAISLLELYGHIRKLPQSGYIKEG